MSSLTKKCAANVAAEIVDAIDAEAFEKARDLISGLKDAAAAEELGSLCFHDYLWLCRPSQADAESFITQSPAPIRTALKDVYECHVRFIAILQGGTTV